MSAKYNIFISGPMTGYPDCNFPVFRQWATVLKLNGHEVFNPTTIFESYQVRADLSPDDPKYKEIVHAIWLNQLRCNAIFLLNGWNHSTGVRNELDTALASGHKIFLESNFRELLSS